MVTNSSEQAAAPSLPTTVAELQERVHTARDALERAIAGLGEQAMIVPGPEGWSIKDHLAHIVTWEQLSLLAHFRKQSFAEAAGLSSDEAAALAQQGTDAMNAFFFERNRNRSLDEVLAAFHSSYNEVQTIIAGLDDAALAAPSNPYAPEAGSLVSLILSDTHDHYQGHTPLIEAIAGL